jgi:hypothetical protein
MGYVLYGLTCGVTSAPWLTLAVSAALLVGALVVISAMQKKSKA